MDTHALTYFSKQAKQFLQLIQDGDPGAARRFKEQFPDAAPSLMRVQHLLANAAGFESWRALRDSAVVAAQLAVLMDRIPLLSCHGIGIFDVPRLSRQERKQKLAGNRRELRRSVNEIEKMIGWLHQHVAKIGTINRRHSSYGLKHLAEKDIGYIPNGVFIAAAILAGYKHRVIPESPNVEFAMSNRSIQALYKRQNEM